MQKGVQTGPSNWCLIPHRQAEKYRLRQPFGLFQKEFSDLPDRIGNYRTSRGEPTLAGRSRRYSAASRTQFFPAALAA